ncbi:MAG TPA: murein biosynthesis integral membrane protein MurJ, partial [bacterium]|nr:murein biosynthesis integral membrane protein MurJ [bacterium]
MGATILSRVTGLGRESTITGLLEVGVATDAYYMALAIPDILRYLVLSGFLGAIFIPLFADVAARRGLADAKTMAGQFLTLTVIIGTLATGVGMLLAPQFIALTQLISPTQGTTPEMIQQAIVLTRIVFPVLLTTALMGLLAGILNSLHDYHTPAWAPIWYNLVFIAGMVGIHLAAPRYVTAETMAVVTVAGAIVQVVVQFPALARQGVHWRMPQFNDPLWRSFVTQIPAAFIGYAALVTNTFVDRAFAFGMEPVMLTAQYLSIRVQQLPVGVFTATLVTALFPSVAQKLSLGRTDEAMEDLYLGLRMCGLTLLPCTVFLMVWSVPVIRLLFNHGEFRENPRALQETAPALAAYATSLFTAAGVAFTTRTFFAIHDRRTPVVMGLSSILLNYAADYLLSKTYNLRLVGIAYSSLIVTGFSFFGSLAIISRGYPVIRRWPFRPETGKMVLLSLLYAAFAQGLAMLCNRLLPLIGPTNHLTPKLADLAYLTAMLAISVIFLLGVAALLRMEEIAVLRRILRRRRSGGGTGANGDTKPTGTPPPPVGDF